MYDPSLQQSTVNLAGLQSPITVFRNVRAKKGTPSTLGQLLTGLAYKSKALENALEDGSIPPVGKAEEVVRLANQASAQARALARGLDPVELTTEGLALALG